MKFRRNQMMAAVKRPVKSLFAFETWKDAAYIAGGSVSAPLVSAMVSKAINTITKKQTIKGTGLIQSGMTFLSSALVGAGSYLITKNMEISRLMLLGGISGVAADITQEQVLPKMGLSDYLPAEMADYLTVPPGTSDYYDPSMNDYLTVPPSMGEYATVPDVQDTVGSGRTQGEF